MRHHQRNFRGSRIHTPGGEASLDRIKKRTEHGRNPAPHHDDIRVENINDIAEPDRQEFGRLLENFTRKSIAGSIGLPDSFAGHGGHFPIGQIENRRFAERICGLCARSGANRRTHCENLDASELAAAADWTVIIDAYVTALSGRPGLAVINAAIENDSSTDTGGYVGIQDIAITTGSTST